MQRYDHKIKLFKSFICGKSKFFYYFCLFFEGGGVEFCPKWNTNKYFSMLTLFKSSNYTFYAMNKSYLLD